LKKIIIGSRGSQLALWQARFIQAQLAKIADHPSQIEIIKTKGDHIDSLPFDKMEGKGFFTKEIEEALLDKKIDLAVHSLKDLMTTIPDGLGLPAVGFREDNREVILVRKESLDPARPLSVKKNGVIGCSSVRRKCQIAYLSPDLQVADLRGNIPTRIDKLRAGQYDAILVAYAGIKRLACQPSELALDLSDIEVIILEREKFLPAPGQGVLALQTRRDDDEINRIVAKLDDKRVRLEIELERGLLHRFEGGCQLPLGAFAEIYDRELRLHAVMGIRNDKRWIDLARASASGNDPQEVIEKVWTKLQAVINKGDR